MLHFRASEQNMQKMKKAGSWKERGWGGRGVAEGGGAGAGGKGYLPELYVVHRRTARSARSLNVSGRPSF